MLFQQCPASLLSLWAPSSMQSPSSTFLPHLLWTPYRSHLPNNTATPSHSSVVLPATWRASKLYYIPTQIIEYFNLRGTQKNHWVQLPSIGLPLLVSFLTLQQSPSPTRSHLPEGDSLKSDLLLTLLNWICLKDLWKDKIEFAAEKPWALSSIKEGGGRVKFKIQHLVIHMWNEFTEMS